MAEIINELTGRVRGKVGNLVYKITNGKTSLSALSTSHNVDNSPNAIKRKNRFRLTVKFAQAVNKLLQLKYLWKTVVVNANDEHKSAFVKIFKKNYPNISDTALNNLIYLIPTFGFGATSTDITLTDALITVDLAPIGTGQGIDLLVEQNAQLACVLFNHTPVVGDASLAPFEFIWKMSDVVTLSLTNPMSFSFDLEGDKQAIYNAYTVRKAYFALITLDADGVPVRFSATFHSV
ncbi:MAG: hypothetical protein ACOYN6_14165 [Ignavibacteria bacterium]